MTRSRAGLVLGLVVALMAPLTSAPAAGGASSTLTRPTEVATSPATPEALLDASGVVAAYTLIVPRSAARSQLQARAVIASETVCPRLHIVTTSGRRLIRDMDKRIPGATTGAAFANIRACEAAVPANADTARVGASDVPAFLPAEVSKLALIGDTGCRLNSYAIQDCAHDWPLAENAQSIARSEPDAIVFVGDFFYREVACPMADQALCGGSPPPIPGMPFTDSQYGWMADALIPMASLFSTAPILAVRGNHESCSRGGNGYFLFFDASPLGADACAPVAGVAPTNITPSWKVDLPTRGGSLRLVVVDSAYGQDASISSWVSTQQPEYERAARLAESGKGSPEVWLITHRPIFGLVTDQYSSGPTWTPWTSMDQQASAEGLLDPYRAIVGSHVHVGQAVDMPGSYPSQFVLGQGGTALDPATGYAIPPFGPLLNGIGQPVSPDFAPYPNAVSQWTSVEFGHVLATPRGRSGDWNLDFQTPRGDRNARCVLQGRSVACS